MKGYCGTFNQETINEIAARPDVAYIEPNQFVAPEVDNVDAPLEAASNDPNAVAYQAGSDDDATTAEFEYVGPDEIEAVEGKDLVSPYAESRDSMQKFSSRPHSTVS